MESGHEGYHAIIGPDTCKAPCYAVTLSSKAVAGGAGEGRIGQAMSRSPELELLECSKVCGNATDSSKMSIEQMFFRHWLLICSKTLQCSCLCQVKEQEKEQAQVACLTILGSVGLMSIRIYEHNAVNKQHQTCDILYQENHSQDRLSLMCTCSIWQCSSKVGGSWTWLQVSFGLRCFGRCASNKTEADSERFNKTNSCPQHESQCLFGALIDVIGNLPYAVTS